MKSIRLNKRIREEIISNVEQAYTLKNTAPAYKNREELTEDLNQAVYDQLIVERTALMNILGTHGYSSNIVRAQEYTQLAANGEHLHSFRAKEYGDLCPLRQAGAVDVTDPKNPKLNELYAAYKKELKDAKVKKDIYTAWELKRDNYMADVRNVIEGCNTTAQLLATWEELEKFIPAGLLDPSTGITLPSVNIANLKKQI